MILARNLSQPRIAEIAHYGQRAVKRICANFEVEGWFPPAGGLKTDGVGLERAQGGITLDSLRGRAFTLISTKLAL